MSIVRLAARPLLAAGFVAAGADRLRHLDATAGQLQPLLSRLQDGAGAPAPEAAPGDASGSTAPDRSRTAARIFAGTQIGAGLLLGLGRMPRLAAVLLAGTGGLNAWLDFSAAPVDTAEQKTERRNALVRNLSLLGGVLLAAVDTAGAPGLAWRTGRLAGDTRRSLAAASHSTGKATRRLNRAARRRYRAADKAVRSTVGGLAA